MSYTMWRKCHKVIIEVRSLAKGDMYFGELSPAEMTICVKSNQTGHQYTCQLKKKKIKEERLYFPNCQSGSATLKTTKWVVSKHLTCSSQAIPTSLGDQCA